LSACTVSPLGDLKIMFKFFETKLLIKIYLLPLLEK